MSASHTQVTVPWRGRTVEIETQWVGVDRADAPCMVFLHEGLGSVAMWRDFPARLCEAAGCRGLVYSRPAYGRSTPRAPQDAWGVDFLHQQALEVLPALLKAVGLDVDRNPPWLLGHSDGGSIALLYAAHFPQQVRGLITLAPHIFVEDKCISSIEDAREAYRNTDLRAKLARFHGDVDSAFWGWNDIWLHPDFRRWNIEAEVARIACPVLAVQGFDDQYGTMEQIERIARLVPHTRLLQLTQCAHSPHRDQAEQVISFVTEFIHLTEETP